MNTNPIHKTGSRPWNKALSSCAMVAALLCLAGQQLRASETFVNEATFYYIDSAGFEEQVDTFGWLSVMVHNGEPYIFDCAENPAFLNLAQRFGFKGDVPEAFFDNEHATRTYLEDLTEKWPEEFQVIDCSSVASSPGEPNTAFEVYKDNESGAYALVNNTIYTDSENPFYLHTTCFEFFRELGVDFRKSTKTDIEDSLQPGLTCYHPRSAHIQINEDETTQLLAAGSGHTVQLTVGDQEIEPIIFIANRIEVIGRSGCGLKVDIGQQKITGKPLESRCAIDLKVIYGLNGEHRIQAIEVFRLPKGQEDDRDLLDQLPKISPLDRIMWRDQIEPIHVYQELYPNVAYEYLRLVPISNQDEHDLCQMEVNDSGEDLSLVLKYNYPGLLPAERVWDTCTLEFEINNISSSEEPKLHSINVHIANEVYRK